MVFYYQGRFASATQHYDHALRSAGQCVDSTTLTATTISLGAIAQQLGDYSRAITLYRNALHMIDESGDRGNEAIALANLGMTLHYLGDNEDGLLYLKRAEVVAQRRVQRDVEAFVFTAEGHTHFALGQLPEAEDCFGKALQLRLALQQAQQAMEPLAGLAEVALTRGEVAAALAYAERMLPVVRSPWFAAAVEFFRVYWACYKALDASDDARASELLTDAYQRLMARAAQIEDDTMRAGYLDRIAVHRAIAESYAAHLHTNGK
jgi:ATP/maltotriose-dependent transcriptional regulator MalT